MTDSTDRPAQEQLMNALDDTIGRLAKEWDFTPCEIIGVLTILAARFAHQTLHEDDE